MPGSNQEHNGIIRHGSKSLIVQFTASKITLVIGKSRWCLLKMEVKNLRTDINCMANC